MHEFSIAEDIISSVLEEAEKHNAKRVKEVFLEIGILMMVSFDQLDFALRSLSIDTIAQGMKIELSEVPAEFECDEGHCHRVEKTDGDMYKYLAGIRCPECNKPMHYISGKECTVKRIIAE